MCLRGTVVISAHAVLIYWSSRVNTLWLAWQPTVPLLSKLVEAAGLQEAKMPVLWLVYLAV